jgi:hypothetical protein
MELNVYWSNSRPNFGDILTPHVLNYFNINYKMVSKPAQANTMCIGSIVHRATDNMIVLGSGLMHTKHRPNINADYRFVRGPLTRNRILELGGSCPEVYGDPALLLPLFCDESKKEHDIGIVPHYVDYEDMKQKYPNYKIINLHDTDPIKVAKEITKCRKIISTSLHGIIAAHAYNIPATWLHYSNKLKGNNVKFRDYFASVGLETKIVNNINDVEFSTIKSKKLDLEKEKFLELK